MGVQLYTFCIQVCLLYALVLVVLAGGKQREEGIYRKQLAGPPSEFELHLLPPATAGALSSLSALISVDLSSSATINNEYVWSQSIPVDTSADFIFTFASPHADSLKLSLTGPDGEALDLNKHASEGVFPIGETSVPVTNFVFQNLTIGSYILHIQTSGIDQNYKVKSALDSASPDAYVIWFNNANTAILSHLNSYNAEVGEDIGIVTRVYDTLTRNYSLGVIPTALRDVVESAVLVMDLPDGEHLDIEMHDDGLHFDASSDDGVYGASLPMKQPGRYAAQAVVRGVDNQGHAFVRSTQHLFTIAPAFHLTGSAVGTKNANENRIDISIGVEADNLDLTYRAYAEVWGKDSSNKDIPICWISSIVDVQESDEVVLELDLNWVALVKAHAPFTLKNVYVQDIDSSIPVASKDEIPLKLDSPSKMLLQRVYSLQPATITEEMRNGVRPAKFTITNETADGGYLLLLHGYCSADNPWEASKEFTNAKFFLQKSVTVSHDQFAKNVINWSSSSDFNSYAIVGHSQGGAVSTHLHNYYWSGLDNTPKTGGRAIQSVGTPYKGCGAAGTAASFGSLFGVGCGRNDDLTKDGSALWTIGITAPTRSKVSFYTTTYEQGKFFGDYCNLAMNLVLDFPNDGVTELSYGMLDGANYISNTEKWCHTSGMKYPAQYNDEQRNKEINSLAAR